MTTPTCVSPRRPRSLFPPLLGIAATLFLLLAVGLGPRLSTAQPLPPGANPPLGPQPIETPPRLMDDTRDRGAVGLPPAPPAVDRTQEKAEVMRRLQELVEQRKRELEVMTPEEREKKFAADREAAREKRRQEQLQREELERQRVVQNTQEAAARALAAAATDEKTSISSTSSRAFVLELRPFHQDVRIGQRFVTEVSAYSESSFQFDRVDVRIAYSPLEVRPLRIFDYPLAEGLSADCPTTRSLGRGLLAYSAELNRPIQGMEHLPLIYVLWESVGVTPNAQLSLGRFGLPVSMNSTIWREDKNLTSSEGMTGAACVNASIAINPRVEKKSPGLQLITGPRNQFAGAPGEVRLTLVKPQAAPAPGEDFPMEVYLANPGGAAFDQVQLAIAFDPQKAEVVDWDKGGWIRTGVNVYDTHAHASFPFNIHTANTVSNSLGRITYEMGTAALRPLPSGSLLRIHCRAKARGAADSFQLVPGGRGRDWYTDVRAAGHSVLAPGESRPLLSQAR